MKVNRVVIELPESRGVDPSNQKAVAAHLAAQRASAKMAADRCIGCDEPIGFDVLHLSGVCGGRYVVLCGPCLTGRLCGLLSGGTRPSPGVNGEEVPSPSHGGGTSPRGDRGGLDLEAALGEGLALSGAAR